MSDEPSLLRLPAVLARTGLSRSGLYREMDAGRFPRPLVITGTRVRAWASDDVGDWVRHQLATARRDGDPLNPTETIDA